MIHVDDIHKSFGKVKAVRGVSFEAPDGKITGLLGPNGAGKSTTLRVLYTVLRPDEGTATIDGINVVADSLVVVLAEKALQRRESTVEQQVQVTDLALGQVP